MSISSRDSPLIPLLPQIRLLQSIRFWTKKKSKCLSTLLVSIEQDIVDDFELGKDEVVDIKDKELNKQKLRRRIDQYKIKLVNPCRKGKKTYRCAPLEQQELQLEQSQGDEEAVIWCEDCNGKGWLRCDFCKGQKTNVKSENKRIYRRCPTCRAVGYVLCKRCKVFKCVTFPNPEYGEELLF